MNFRIFRISDFVFRIWNLGLRFCLQIKSPAAAGLKRVKLVFYIYTCNNCHIFFVLLVFPPV